jgi:hypothetical protein
MKITFLKMIVSENAKNNKCLEITFGIQLHPGFLANLSNIKKIRNPGKHQVYLGKTRGNDSKII